MQFLQTVLVHSMWNYDPANYWICSLYDIQLFIFSFVWKPPGGAVLFFTDSSCKIKVLLWFCSSDWIISCWGGCCSINQQRQLVLIVLWWDTSGNSVTQLSLGWTHTVAAATLHPLMLLVTVCVVSPFMTPRRQLQHHPNTHTPLVAICRNPRQNIARIEGMICLECRTNEENDVDTFSSWRWLFICLYMDIYSKLPESRLIVIYLKWGQIHCNQCETFFFTRTHVFFSLSLSVPSLLTRG